MSKWGAWSIEAREECRVRRLSHRRRVGEFQLGLVAAIPFRQQRSNRADRRNQAAPFGLFLRDRSSSLEILVHDGKHFQQAVGRTFVKGAVAAKIDERF